MLENIDFTKHKSFVELGPGTGVFTRIMLERMQPDAKLLVFELHPPFYNSLLDEFKHDERIIIINDSAAKLNQYLESNNMKQVDFVISSLPMANFNKKLVHNIIDHIYDALKPGGQYIQFQYSLKSKKSIQRKFKKIQIKFTSRNLPPAFVYCAKK